jgi:hypothetical protein
MRKMIEILTLMRGPLGTNNDDRYSTGRGGGLIATPQGETRPLLTISTKLVLSTSTTCASWIITKEQISFSAKQ